MATSHPPSHPQLPRTSYLCSTLILLLIAFPWQILALPNGAPVSVCDSMLPSHNAIPASVTVPPYRVMTSVSALDPASNQPLFIRIVGQPEGLKFGGFMIQARNRQNPNQVIGQFRPTEDGVTKLISCFGGQENTATHVSPSEKQEITLEWIPPRNFEGEVVFNATVAQSFHMFWVGIPSYPVRIARGISTNSTPSFDPSAAFQPATTTKRSPYEPQYVAAQPTQSPSYYEDCGVTKTCFGLEDGCVRNQNCRTMVKVRLNVNVYEFELLGSADNVAYVAVGISEDDKMGDDLVGSCTLERGKVNLYTQLTSEGPNYGATRTGVTQNTAQLVSSSYKDGAIKCTFNRFPKTDVKGMTFDLSTKKYFLLLATGSEVHESGVAFHDLGRIPSDKAILLSELHSLQAKSKILVRLHGTFMSIAWLGTTAAGIIMARYFKMTWVGRQVGGKDLWFVWHRLCMVTTVTLTVVGCILILIEINGWSQDGSPHAALGLTTTILCLIQMLGGLLRPSPDDKKRVFFNWGHWLGGNLAHLIAIVTIFFAVRLKRAALPVWLDWVLVAYVLFYCIVHLLFSFFGCLADRKLSDRRNTFPLSELDPSTMSRSNGRMEAPFSAFRKLLLSVVIVVLIVIVVAVACIIFLSPL